MNITILAHTDRRPQFAKENAKDAQNINLTQFMPTFILFTMVIGLGLYSLVFF